MFLTSARCTRYHLSSPQSFSRLKSPLDVDRMQPRSSLRCCLDRIEIRGLNTGIRHRHCCELFAGNSLGPLSLIFQLQNIVREQISMMIHRMLENRSATSAPIRCWKLLSTRKFRGEVENNKPGNLADNLELSSRLVISAVVSLLYARLNFYAHDSIRMQF